MPMIDDTLGLVHVPRTGGRSILAAFGDPRGPAGMPQHAPASALRAARPGAFLAGFVRNPWDRMASLHAAFTGGTRYCPFAEWLWHETAWPEGGPPIQRKPQTWWLDGCDFIGRFERLQEDFDDLCDLVGAERRTLPHLKDRHPRRPYREVFDDEARTAFERWHVADIERWEYEF